MSACTVVASRLPLPAPAPDPAWAEFRSRDGSPNFVFTSRECTARGSVVPTPCVKEGIGPPPPPPTPSDPTPDPAPDPTPEEPPSAPSFCSTAGAGSARLHSPSPRAFFRSTRRPPGDPSIWITRASSGRARRARGEGARLRRSTSTRARIEWRRRRRSGGGGGGGGEDILGGEPSGAGDLLRAPRESGPGPFVRPAFVGSSSLVKHSRLVK